jgi:hypothetical protein
MEIEECMWIDIGKRHLRILLTYHERIVHQVLNARTIGCCCSHVHSVRKSFNKVSHTLPFGLSSRSRL